MSWTDVEMRDQLLSAEHHHPGGALLVRVFDDNGRRLSRGLYASSV